MLSEAEYFERRAQLTENFEALVNLEKRVMDFLVTTVHQSAAQLHQDFSHSRDLMPGWIAYPPKQRGRGAIGDSQPWSEVGEKSLSFNLLRAICERRSDIRFPGLPFGANMRFATDEAFIHFDVKMTGPRDNKDEVVAPPQQISGDGAAWNLGVVNSSFLVKGQKSSFGFQPKLPPFYILEERTLTVFDLLSQGGLFAARLGRAAAGIARNCLRSERPDDVRRPLSGANGRFAHSRQGRQKRC